MFVSHGLPLENEAYQLLKMPNSCCKTKCFGHSPSSVDGQDMQYKKLYMYAHTESAPGLSFPSLKNYINFHFMLLAADVDARPLFHAT